MYVCKKYISNARVNFAQKCFRNETQIETQILARMLPKNEMQGIRSL